MICFWQGRQLCEVHHHSGNAHGFGAEEGTELSGGHVCSLHGLLNGDLEALYDKSEGFFRRQLILQARRKPPGRVAGLADASVYNERYAKWKREDLPILPCPFRFEISPDKRDQFSILKELMNREDVTEVVNACDAGREGELIFRSVYYLADCQKPMKRLWISSMEDEAIRDGFQNLRPGSDFDGLYKSALCRAKADWLVGINATRYFSLLYGTKLNVGRVMSPTLSLLVERESTISAFVPEDYYTVNGNFQRKADMFTKRTIQPHRVVTSVGTASEALTISIAERACVDLGFMSSLSGKPIEELTAALRGVIFHDPTLGSLGDHAGWVTADEYLSGNHVIWNSTALDEHSKFRNFWGSTKAIRRLSDTICIENGYSIVENPKGKGKTYDKWLGNQKQPSHRERICYAIDEALAQKPRSFEELLELLEHSGYQVKGGKVPSLLGEGQKRFIRMDTLGAGYTPDDLRAIIAGTKAHTPKKKLAMDAPAKPSGSLLIDIQAKLQEGKGAGYARWAKNFNLKQLSQTLIYLEENNLLDRGVLEERTAAVTAQYHTLSGNMKSAEQRMAEIKVLQQHIINYAKTRDTYVAYRKAGYSKKFLAEHESEIILHKAAKQFFDEQGLEKLPTVKSLQAEYAQLLSEKKAMYADYQKAREDMRALQTAKANVDRILGDNSLTAERESEKDGR